MNAFSVFSIQIFIAVAFGKDIHFVRRRNISLVVDIDKVESKKSNLVEDPSSSKLYNNDVEDEMQWGEKVAKPRDLLETVDELSSALSISTMSMSMSDSPDKVTPYPSIAPTPAQLSSKSAITPVSQLPVNEVGGQSSTGTSTITEKKISDVNSKTEKKDNPVVTLNERSQSESTDSESSDSTMMYGVIAAGGTIALGSAVVILRQGVFGN